MAIAEGDNTPKKIKLHDLRLGRAAKLGNAMPQLASASFMPLCVTKKVDLTSREHFIEKVAEKSVTGTTLSDG